MPLQNVFISYNIDHFEDDEDRTSEGKKSKVWKQSLLVEVTAALLCLFLAGLRFEGDVGEGHWFEDEESESESD